MIIGDATQAKIVFGRNSNASPTGHVDKMNALKFRLSIVNWTHDMNDIVKKRGFGIF